MLSFACRVSWADRGLVRLPRDKPDVSLEEQTVVDVSALAGSEKNTADKMNML